MKKKSLAGPLDLMWWGISMTLYDCHRTMYLKIQVKCTGVKDACFDIDSGGWFTVIQISGEGRTILLGASIE